MEQKQGFLKEYTAKFDKKKFEVLREEISFSEYVDKIHQNPLLIRTAYQRIYDMIISKGFEEIERDNRKCTHYKFFDNPACPIFGLENTLNELVKFIKGAAGGYGAEKRVLLLHGPVGSSKSTICRCLKYGLEEYTKSEEGSLYTFKWVNLPEDIFNATEDCCPMHEEPLRLLPPEVRNPIVEQLNEIHLSNVPEKERPSLYRLRCDGDLDPRCKKFMVSLLEKYQGDLDKVLTDHIRVIRFTFSEAERRGIGTFQPKDEKNQDSTELTGDINYRNMATYGSDSDSRAFNFDGEFCVSNRGLIEFIEMLKLANEFLYDLLGASQERQIKPKKFPQIAIDEALIGHSVHGSTLIPHVYDGVLDVLPIEELAALDVKKLRVFSFNIETKQVELSEVKKVFSHEFKGEWVENHQDGDVLVTTPNHSVYNKDYETFYPGEDTTSDILTLDIPDYLLNYPQTERFIHYLAQEVMV